MEQGVKVGAHDAIVLHCAIAKSSVAAIGQSFAVAYVFRTREEQVEDEDGQTTTVLVPTLGSQYALAGVKAYCLAAIGGDVTAVYTSRTELEQADFEKLGSDNRTHVDDVTVTEVPNKGRRGSRSHRYAWAPVAHRR